MSYDDIDDDLLMTAIDDIIAEMKAAREAERLREVEEHRKNHPVEVQDDEDDDWVDCNCQCCRRWERRL